MGGGRPSYLFPRPALTVDVAAFSLSPAGRLVVLLVRRGRPPFAGRWALPGGFVDREEDLPQAARREFREETGLQAGRLFLFGVFGRPGRDPRGHTVSIGYGTVLPAPPPAPRAADDAAEAAWHPARRPPPLAFDHRELLRAARRRLAEEAARDPRWLARWRPQPFSRTAWRAALGAAGVFSRRRPRAGRA